MDYVEIPKSIINRDLGKIKNKVLKVLREELDNTIGTDEYGVMTYAGLTGHQESQIRQSINKSLNILTENLEEEWIDKVSSCMINIIDGFFDSLIEAEVFGLLYCKISSYVIAEIFFNNIKWHLEKKLFM